MGQNRQRPTRKVEATERLVAPTGEANPRDAAIAAAENSVIADIVEDVRNQLLIKVKQAQTDSRGLKDELRDRTYTPDTKALFETVREYADRNLARLSENVADLRANKGRDMSSDQAAVQQPTTRPGFGCKQS